MQLCCVLVTEGWPILWVCGTAEALAGDVNGGFSSLQGAGGLLVMSARLPVSSCATKHCSAG